MSKHDDAAWIAARDSKYPQYMRVKYKEPIVLSISVTQEVKEALEAAVIGERTVTASAFIRKALIRELRKLGYLPPDPPDPRDAQSNVEKKE
jgi:hypothetical protein